MDCRAGGHARVRGAAAFDADHGLATPKVVRGNVPNQPRLVAGLAVFNAAVGDRGAVQSAIEMQDATLAARIEVAAHTVADLDRRLGQIDTAIEEAAKRGKTNTALAAIESQRRARVSLVDERNQEASSLATLKAERAIVAARRHCARASSAGTPDRLQC